MFNEKFHVNENKIFTASFSKNYLLTKAFNTMILDNKTLLMV